MSVFLEVSISLAMLGIAVYAVAMAWIAVMAHRTKVGLSQPTQEALPPYITGEDLLG